MFRRWERRALAFHNWPSKHGWVCLIRLSASAAIACIHVREPSTVTMIWNRKCCTSLNSFHAIYIFYERVLLFFDVFRRNNVQLFTPIRDVLPKFADYWFWKIIKSHVVLRSIWILYFIFAYVYDATTTFFLFCQLWLLNGNFSVHLTRCAKMVSWATSKMRTFL